MLSPEKILQTGFGFWSSKVLLTAVRLGVFTELARGPRDADSLRDTLGLHPRAACDFFDTLVALGFLTREQGHYANTPETDAFLDRNKPAYIGGILEMCDARLYRFWDHLADGLRTGEPQNEATRGGADFFGALYADPARLESFLRAMTGLSHGANLAIASKIPFHQYQTYADIGTAQGDLAVQIALAHPHLTGTGYDLPAVRPVFENYVAANGLSARLQFQSADFFRDPLPNVDVILMGHILHDWDLDQKRTLIAKAYAALPPGGTFVAYDALIDDDRRHNAFGLLMSLNMLIETPGGFDYTGADGQAWLKEAGFRKTYVAPLVGPDSMVVGVK